MAFDDDDNLTLSAVSTETGANKPSPENRPGGADDASPEDDEEGAPQDFRHFTSLFVKKGVSGQTLRRGEKDFEAHGTRAQESLLEQSRAAMEDVLGYTRVHGDKAWSRAWYAPDVFSGELEQEEREKTGKKCADGSKREVFPRDRVVGVESHIGKFVISMGTTIPNVGKTQPGWDRLWLLPEEALFLVERGSLDLWWPRRPLAEIFPLGKEANCSGDVNQDEENVLQVTELTGMPDTDDDYSLGMPLSLQAAYALLIGVEGERGKVTLEQYQVYSNLRRHGYIVFRASPATAAPLASVRSVHTTLWQWLFSLISAAGNNPRSPHGPLVRPGVYRSYAQVFDQLHIIPRHVPYAPDPSTVTAEDTGPFQVHFHVWKSSTTTNFSKTRPPPPDFYMSVVDARATNVPSLGAVTGLLEKSPADPPRAQWTGPGRLYPRLKHGHRNVVLAVVDHGVVNYVRFAEGAFGEEPIWQRFDSNIAPRGGKQGGRGGSGRGRGRGGKRGRGRHRA